MLRTPYGAHGARHANALARLLVPDILAHVPTARYGFNFRSPIVALAADRLRSGLGFCQKPADAENAVVHFMEFMLENYIARFRRVLSRMPLECRDVRLLHKLLKRLSDKPSENRRETRS